MSRLIALIGPAGCGKTTIAKYLEKEKNYVHLKFADGLKNMLRSIGLTEEELEGDLKEVHSKTLLGTTPRYAMQTLGTEWGRNLINENIWSNIFKIKAGEALNLNTNVVVDDLRFLNEADVVKELGGTIIRVTRNDFLTDAKIYEHQSETEGKNIKEDWVLLNCSTIENLLTQVSIILNEEEKK